MSSLPLSGALHSFVLSSDFVFSKEDFGLHSAAVRAFKPADHKVAASWMLFDKSDLYRLAAFWGRHRP